MQFTAILMQDAIIKTTKSEKQLVAFPVVINNDYKTKEGEKKKHRTFINCAYWRNTGIAAHLKKGSVVTLSGRMDINAYKKQDGEFNATLSFTPDTIKIVTTPKSEATITTPTEKKEAVEDLPF